jgi:hypothetical protein
MLFLQENPFFGHSTVAGGRAKFRSSVAANNSLLPFRRASGAQKKKRKRMQKTQKTVVRARQPSRLSSRFTSVSKK